MVRYELLATSELELKSSLNSLGFIDINSPITISSPEGDTVALEDYSSTIDPDTSYDIIYIGKTEPIQGLNDLTEAKYSAILDFSLEYGLSLQDMQDIVDNITATSNLTAVKISPDISLLPVNNNPTQEEIDETNQDVVIKHKTVVENDPDSQEVV